MAAARQAREPAHCQPCQPRPASTDARAPGTGSGSCLAKWGHSPFDGESLHRQLLEDTHGERILGSRGKPVRPSLWERQWARIWLNGYIGCARGPCSAEFGHGRDNVANPRLDHRSSSGADPLPSFPDHPRVPEDDSSPNAPLNPLNTNGRRME